MIRRERKNVYKVYDKIADWFAANRYSGLMEKKYLDDLITRLPQGANILDLGCGTGVPILKYLLGKRFEVVGVDGSDNMLTIAKRSFPETEFILKDMRKLNLERKFDAIIAWHSLWHLPAVDQPLMFSLFKRHLKLNGILLFTSGTEHMEGWGMNGGESLFHASLDLEEYKKLLIRNNFQILTHQINDPSCGGATIWMAQLVV